MAAKQQNVGEQTIEKMRNCGTACQQESYFVTLYLEKCSFVEVCQRATIMVGWVH